MPVQLTMSAQPDAGIYKVCLWAQLDEGECVGEGETAVMRWKDGKVEHWLAEPWSPTRSVFTVPSSNEAQVVRPAKHCVYIEAIQRRFK